MSSRIVASRTDSAQHTLPEVAGVPAKAGLGKREQTPLTTGVVSAERKQIGQVIDYARRLLGWSIKELAAEIAKVDGVERDRGQVSNWILGTQRPHFDVLLQVPELRVPLLLGWAHVTEGAEIKTQVTVQRKVVAR